MSLPKRDAVHDALTDIDNLARDIRRAAFDAAPVEKMIFTDEEVNDFINFQNNLGAALAAFRGRKKQK